MNSPEAFNILCAATQRVLEVDGVSLLGRWGWCAEDKLWTIRCKISIDVPENSLVPSTTDWYVRVPTLYPDGAIDFFPSKKNSIEGLFPHQYPFQVPESKPWQSSFLCLAGHLRVLDRVGASTEPRDWHTRLKWTFERAVKWLKCAANNDLMREGERFELPFHKPEQGKKGVKTVIVSESLSHQPFSGITPKYGVVDLSMISENSGVVQAYRDSENNIIRRLKWGTHLTSCPSTPVKGLWIQLDKLPVVDPWQQPKIWGELRQSCPNTELNNLIKKAIRLIPIGQPIILLLGALIPEVVGEEPHLIHWQALLLPIFKSHYDGYRNDRNSLWNAYRMRNLGNSKSLPWRTTENWHPTALATRGQLPKRLREMRTVIIGVGALGAPLAEHLVRGGITEMTLIDMDYLSAGNLVRHSLTMCDLGGNKAEKLEAHLNSVNPHACVRAIAKSFSPESEVPDEILEADLIIDATGSDDVTAHLNSLDWNQPKHFISVSIGRKACRLYAFYGHGIRFPVDNFNDSLAPYLKEERDQFRDDDVQWEGVGCFHPVFEARNDDLGLWSSLATKLIVQFIKNTDADTDFIVLEQCEEMGIPQILHHRCCPQNQ
jgi:molybdopterin/thiamine biosynthesis adenylyltransferase